MVVCLEPNSWVTGVLYSINTNITGSPFLTLLIIVMLILIIAIGFRIPIEYTAILLFPLFLGLLYCDATWWQVTGVSMLYLATLMAKHYVTK